MYTTSPVVGIVAGSRPETRASVTPRCSSQNSSSTIALLRLSIEIDCQDFAQEDGMSPGHASDRGKHGPPGGKVRAGRRGVEHAGQRRWAPKTGPARAETSPGRTSLQLRCL